MRYNAVEFQFGPETLSRIGDDWLRRWQETVDDAQDTMTKAMASANPVDAWSMQLAFGVRNAQRWLGWGDWETIASEPEPVDTNADEAPAPEGAAAEAAAAPETPTQPETLARPDPSAAQEPPAVEPVAGMTTEQDELQRIRGIGPAIAEKLYARGITRFSQIAALDADAIARLDDELSLKGGITRNQWVRQAEALATKH